MARTPSRPHVPYRADDPTLGKKTGIRVPRIDATSDGFEPFDELLTRAKGTGRTPPRRKKKSVPRAESDEEDEDEDDEEDVIKTPRAQTPGRAAHFNEVPSPRARQSIGRVAAGPSRLSTSGGMHDDDFGGHDMDMDMPEPSPTRGKGKGTARTTHTPKGKGRALPPVEEDDSAVEDDIARGMLDVEMAGASDDEDEQEEEAPPKKKAKTQAKAQPPPTKAVKPKPKPKPAAARTHLKENRDRDPPPGVRRSQRVFYAPLEFWRNEKVVFGPREAGAAPRLVPHITEIVRVPKEPVAPLAKRARSTSKRKRSASATPAIAERIVETVVERVVEVEDPEEGWDDDTDPQAVVRDYRTGADVTRRVAFTKRMFKPLAAAGNAWFFQKIFGDGDFMAAGQLVIPVDGKKPGKGTKDNTYIFFVVEGAVNLIVCETSLIIATGGMFMIPRGNTYHIENIGTRDAKLFFTQARKMREDEADEDAPLSAGTVLSAGAGAGGGRAASVANPSMGARRG